MSTIVCQAEEALMKLESINMESSIEVTLAPNSKQMCPFNSLNTLQESETIAAEISIWLIKSAGLIMMRSRVMNEDGHIYQVV